MICADVAGRFDAGVAEIENGEALIGEFRAVLEGGVVEGRLRVSHQ